MRVPVQNPDIGKPRNPNYEKDIVRVLSHNRWILKSIGIWPAVLTGSRQFLPNVMIGFCNLVLFFAIVPCSLHIVYDLKDTTMRLKLLGLLSFCLTSLLKYWALAARRPKIKECIELVEIDWKQVELSKDRELMLKYGKMGRNLTILCLVFMYTGGTIYHTFMQYAIGTFVDEHNRTIKPLVYPSYSGLYDVQRSPVYELVYIVHCMCGYVIYSVTTGACGLAALFVTHICGQIDIVLSRLDNLVDHERNSNSNGRFVEIIERHLRTLRFSEVVDTILQEVCFLEFIGSTFMICLLEYYCITDWEQGNTIGVTTYSMLLISLTFNIFILCYIGELLMDKASNVGISCFMIDWYRLPNKTIRGLILIIAMSNNPAKISAGMIADLNLSTFGKILKTSLAYLSFLRTAVV
ncbi:odorant receptor 4-like [Colletes gigas]|uniref:odorant receptor 4-like n=1 Tax=Colletes gigas TaxID=935657 RepID=UPI001C9A3D8D|nr:odorant receptor 4-like [Colletes gigas]